MEVERVERQPRQSARSTQPKRCEKERVPSLWRAETVLHFAHPEDPSRLEIPSKPRGENRS